MFYFSIVWFDEDGLPKTDVKSFHTKNPEETVRRGIVAERLAKGGRVKSITKLTAQQYDEERNGGCAA